MPEVTTSTADASGAGSKAKNRTNFPDLPENYSHVKPKAPLLSLNKPGRLRVANMLALFGVSASTFHDGVKSGRYPKPDTYDGKIPIWFTSTPRKHLGAAK